MGLDLNEGSITLADKATLDIFGSETDDSSIAKGDDDWLYFKEITLVNPCNAYQMLLNVTKNSGGDVNCSGHCNDNFSDIRFFDIDKTTSLNYWIETKTDGDYARIWVKLPSDVETDEKLLMYYGNPSAQTMSNGKQTFIFFDDFNTYNTTIWGEYDPTDKITVTSEDGLLHISFGSISGGISAGVATNTPITAYGRVVAKLKGEKGSNPWNMPIFLYLYSNSDNLMQNIYRETGTSSSNTRYNVQYKSDGVYYEEQYSTESYSSLEWRIYYHDRLENTQKSGAFEDHYQGERIGTEASWNNPASPDAFIIRLWMRSWDSGLDGYYDWVFVAKCVEQEPSVSSVGSELFVTPPTLVFVDDDYTSSTPGWGYDHFSVIQDGIDAVAENGTVIVSNGTYYENLIVNKPIDLIGENNSNTIIDGQNNGTILQISYNDDVKINGFKFRNCGSGGNDHCIYCWSCNSIITRDNIFYNTDSYAIHFRNCNNITINNNYFNQIHRSSIYLAYSENISVIDNYLEGSDETAVYVWQSKDCFVKNNTIVGNSIGVKLQSRDYTKRNYVIDNYISSNLVCGIKIECCDGNYIYHNSFVNNYQNYLESGTNNNTWDNGYPSGGNYWSDYNGVDDDGDGIGDTPYILQSIDRDNYPFMHQDGWLNNPPYQPDNPTPMNNSIDIDINIELSWNATDPDDGDLLTYDIYLDKDNSNPTTLIASDWPYQNISTPVLDYESQYCWKVVARDSFGVINTSDVWSFTTVDIPNTPPETPEQPDGPINIEVDELADYLTSATDPDGDMVQYRFSWDDDTYSDWTELVQSGQTAGWNHSWSQEGTYKVRAQARDSKLAKSGWSDYLLVIVGESTNIPPTVEITYPTDGATVSGIITIEGQAEDTDGTIEEVIVTINGVDTHIGGRETWDNWWVEYNTIGFENGIYQMTAVSIDNEGAQSEPDSIQIEINNNENQPPEEPTIDGPNQGKFGTEYTYEISSIDPDDDQIKYRIDWGDNDTEETDYYESGETANVGHTWNRESRQNHRFLPLADEQQFTIRVKSIDSNGAESDWSTLEVSMPSTPDNPWLALLQNIVSWFSERFPMFDWLMSLPVFVGLF
mgnify:CR=1 FL=1